MRYYIGLDVSLKRTQICVLDEAGKICFEGWADTQADLIAAKLAAFEGKISLIGLETGAMTPFLHRSLKRDGFPVVCMDARAASDALKGRAVKTDKADARALAEMLRTGWYRAVHVKSEQSHRFKALLSARDQLVKAKRMILCQIRGLLRPFGKTIHARQGTKRFAEEARGVVTQNDILYACISSLLEALDEISKQITTLDAKVKAIVKTNKPCWHLTSVPGIGPVTALSFLATIEDPHRFKRNRDVGTYLGLTPRRYQSGDRDIIGGISRQGDAMTRHYLYEAANSLLSTVKSPSALKKWGFEIKTRAGAKKARCAVARKMAVIMCRLWKQEAHFTP